jgi:hypothetical protein
VVSGSDLLLVNMSKPACGMCFSHRCKKDLNKESIESRQDYTLDKSVGWEFGGNRT